MKKCYKCQESKELNKFSNDKSTKDQKASICKSCVQIRDKNRYRRINPNILVNRNPSSKLGGVYGLWTVKKLLSKRNDHGSPLYECECICGQIREISIGNLKCCGSVCRCSSYNELRDAKQKSEFSGPARYIYKSYIRGASNRKLDFLLSFDEMNKLCKENCHYCGQIPSTTYRKTSYLYNGLDRVDNTKGYFAKNVVPCCTECNFAKRQMTYDKFLSWISRIRNFNLPERININSWEH